MLYDESLSATPPENPSAEVWRFMIDHKFQGKGYGKAALLLAVEHLKRKNVFSSIELSYVPGNDGAVKLYEAVGFENTGKEEDGEIIMALKGMNTQ